MTDVSKDAVGQTVQDFINYDGVTELSVTQQSNGKFTVTPVH